MASEQSVEPEELEVVVARLLAATGVAQERQAQLQHALDSRVAVEQAKGMLAERLGVSVDDAFELLRSTARSHRRRVHEVALAVLARDGSYDELLRRASAAPASQAESRRSTTT
jgi:AmiR/NasT family two-component response regulator